VILKNKLHIYNL